MRLSRRRFIQGAAAGGVATGTAGAFAWRPWEPDRDSGGEGLIDHRGPRQAGIVSPRTAYAIVAAFDVVTPDLRGLLADLSGRVAELTAGYPDRLDPLDNADLPPSDTGELGYDRRRYGRLTITLGLGASLFESTAKLRDRRPPALSRMPSFPGDNLDRRRCDGDLVVVFQADDLLICHHALRDVLRRTKGRLEGRWAQPGFQRFAAEPPEAGVADARGLLGFPDGSQNLRFEDEDRIFVGSEGPAWARGGTYLAVRLIRLKLERWDRLSRVAQERSIGRHKLTGAPLGGREERELPALDDCTPRDAHIRMANPRDAGDEARRFLRRPFSYSNGFDEYGLLDSGSVFMAFCRDLDKQFATVKRRTLGQDLDEYMVAIGGGFFFCPPGVGGDGDVLAGGLVSA